MPNEMPASSDAARLYQKQLEAVQEICAALAAKNDVEELLRETLRVSLDTVEADAGSLLLYEPERRRLVFRHVIGKEQLVGQEIDPETDMEGRAALVFRTGQAQLTNTTQEHYNPAFDVVTGYHTQTLLTVPLKTLGSPPIGVLQVLNKCEGEFTQEDVNLLKIVASLAATVIANARLAKEAELAAVTRAIGDLGHDIKNALTPLQGIVQTTVEAFINPMFAELDQIYLALQEQAPALAQRLQNAMEPLKEWMLEAESSIQDSCTDIREMVSEIADYVKGTQSAYFEELSIGDIIKERLKRLQVIARNRQVSISYEGLENIPPFCLDRRLVGRALYNLVHNALGAIDAAVRKKQIELRPFFISWYVRGLFPTKRRSTKPIAASRLKTTDRACRNR
ncbi:GAF domain [Chthonomonas calidirosea]|uniref:GAF domain n=1 Tax=Chthonomonas calidirosea (strain DSM 23976 / ICMP 18418 / T49) TaxID=1303518 RepID=S0ETU4_CHTCT|nr:GAF domain-containing protein [Chthonomonas calidirosea]CCW34933.1 GAF domain [Chthonomonas calidirosea T49]CEK13372.1 GAF domain [Chthonomonas calidirosea]